MTKNFRERIATTLFIGISVFASVAGYSQATTFQKSYISPSNVQYINNDAIQLTGNSFVIAGAGVYLTKTDARGGILWSEKFYEATTYYDESYTGALQPTFDGGLMIGASTIYVNSGLGINHYYMYLVKTDATGKPVWSYLYGDSNEGGCSGSTGSFVSSLKQTSDSGYIVMGFTNDFGFGCTNGMYVLKIDKNGNQQWSETFDISGNIRTDGDIIQAADGGYVVIGAGDMLRLGSGGNVMWAKTFGGGSGAGIKQIANNYYVGFGSTLIKTDTSGNVIWANNYSTSLSSIAVTADSGCAITGTSNSYSGAMLVRINADGTVAFANSYGASGVGGNAVLQTLDQGFAVLGYSNISSSNLYFIKTDSLGNSGCSQLVANISPTSVNVNPTTFTPDAVMRTSEVFADSTVLTHVTTTVDSICASSVNTGLSASVNKMDVTCNGLCNGMATAIPTGGTSPYSFLWNTQPADTAQAITGLCAGGYVVTITDHAGDTATSNINIMQPVAIASTISAVKDTICAGDTATLLVTSNAIEIQWQSSTTGTNFGNIQGAVDSTYSAIVLQNTAFRVIGSNGACSDTSSSFSLQVNQLPIPTLTAPDTLICSGDSTQVCTSNNFTHYSWNNGDTAGCTTAKVAGGFWVTVTDANGCSAISQHQQISVYPVPSVSIVVSGDTLSSFGEVTYQWYFNDTAILNATNPVYIAQQPGNYAVEVTDTNGCKAISNNTPVSITGIKDITGNNSIIIYPNPASGSVFVSGGEKFVSCKIRILNIAGQEVQQQNFAAGSNSLIQINIAGLPAGVYELQLLTDNNLLTSKLIKQ